MAVQEPIQAQKADDQVLASPPSLWPHATTDDLMVAPIFNGTLWFAMVKASTPSTLRPEQQESLRQMGFREGSEGRWIYPARATQDVVERLAQILEAPLDVTRPEQYIFLKPGTSIEPAVPLDIQAGIRWFWKQQPQSLLTEIQTALESREDELSRQTLEATLNQRLNNRLRIQRWVALALSGEISPVTEPILGLGLQKAGQQYGAFENWPQSLKEWHQKLAAERGEPVMDEEPISSSQALKDALAADYRPPVGTHVSWTVDGQRDKGVVVDHDIIDKETLWVSSSNLSPLINGVYFPTRKRVGVRDLNGYAVPDESGRTTPEAPAELAVLKPVNPDLLKPQKELAVGDLDAQYQAMISRGIQVEADAMTALEMMYRAGNLRGHSPLMPAESGEGMITYWYGIARNIVHSSVGDGREVEASILIRDLILDDFNAAQPPSPNGETPILAVLPMPVLGAQSIEDYEVADPAKLQVLRDQQFCRVGIHPAFGGAMRNALQGWAESMGEHFKDRDPELLRSLSETARQLSRNTLFADGLSLGASYYDLRQAAESLLVRSPHEVRHGSVVAKINHILEHKDDLVAKSGYTLFTDHKSAGEWVNGLNPRIAELTERNERLLGAVGELTNTASADLEKTPHPVFAVIDELHKHGLPRCTKAQALALINCDLGQRMTWLGQIASLNGARLPMTHVSAIQQSKPEDEQNIEPGTGNFYLVDAAYTTTGWIQTGEVNRPFQITMAARSKDLSKLAQEMNSTHKLQSNGFGGRSMFEQEDAGSRGASRQERYSSLGRLVDLHANYGLDFGEPFDGEVVPEETLDNVPMNIFTLNHLGEIETLNRANSDASICVEPLEKLAAMPTDPIGDLHPSTLAQHCRGARSALLTLTPSWRNHKETQDQMREALRFWVDDQKHLKALRDPGAYVEKLERNLVEDPHTEMLVVATKQTSRRILNEVHKVTRADIIKANNDRALAIEHGILTMKARDQSLGSGWRFAAFDAATVLRPQALRVLNERREALRRERDGNPEAPELKTARRGKRQDKGVVAGLSIKDLRGKTTTVLSNLRHASNADQGRYITKTKLWDAPDWTSLYQPDEVALNEGERAMEPIVAAFFDYARKQLPGQPPANIPMVNQAYAELTLALRDAMDEIRTDEELRDALGLPAKKDIGSSDNRSGNAETPNPDGALAKAIHRAQQFCERERIPYNLMFGSDGLYSSFSSKVYHTNWYRKAERLSRMNTHWSVDTTTGNSQRRVANKDETGAMPMLQALVRRGGEDYRAGTDIDEQTMLTTFGFSGVEYGKSMTQADRTAYLNQAYDGFMDLAKALNIPPKALSLGGTLGLAFGSRGRGGRNAALAHFEPTNNVINLTRMKGAGSMAHEYGHALANYFYRLSKGTPGDRNAGDITEVLSRQLTRQAREPKIVSGNLRNPVAEAIAVVMQSIQYKLPPKTDSQGILDTEGYTLTEAGAAMEGNRSPATSPLVEGARVADRQRSTPYWGTPEELFARSFETWIHETLSHKSPGYQNDFLVRPDKLSAWGVPVDQQSGRKQAQLYPEGEQLKAIDQAFRKLFKTVEHREIEVNHEHLGKISLPILYSHDTGSIYAVTQREHEIIAECVMNEVARMCGDRVWVQWQQRLLDGEGNEVAGRYRGLPAGNGEIERKVLGVIDLAYGTKMGTAYHEAFHFAQSALITEPEQAMLDRAFRVGSPLHERLCDSLKADNRGNLIPHCDNPKEAQAHAYEMWVKGKLRMEVQEQPNTLFGRVKRFLSRISNLGKESGFQTPEHLFRAFYNGQLANRSQMNLATQKVSDVESNQPGTETNPEGRRPAGNSTNEPHLEPEASASEFFSAREDTDLPALR